MPSSTFFFLRKKRGDRDQAKCNQHDKAELLGEVKNTQTPGEGKARKEQKKEKKYEKLFMLIKLNIQTALAASERAA